MNRNHLIAAFLAMAIAGCGGDSGSDANLSASERLDSDELSGSDEFSESETPDSRDTPHILTLTRLNISAGDVIAQTTVSESIATSPQFLTRKFNRLVQNWQAPSIFSKAVAAPNYPPLQTKNDFEASRSYVNGELTSFELVLKSYARDAEGEILLDGNDLPTENLVECDLSTAEIRINDLYLLNEETGDLLTSLSIPDTVNSRCEVNYRDAVIVVNEHKDVFEITDGLTAIKDIIPAQTPAFNSSGTPLLIDSNEVVHTLDIESDGVKLTQVTTEQAPINTHVGAIAFDGRYLVATSKRQVASTATYFVYEKGSTAFRALRPDGWDTNSGLSVLLDEKGSFLVHVGSRQFSVIDMEDLSMVPFLDYLGVDRFSNDTWCEESERVGDSCRKSFEPTSIFGAIGRYQKWILGNRAMAWNYESFELTGSILCLPDFDYNGQCDPEWSSMVSDVIYAVDKNKAKYARYSLADRSGIVVDLDDWGYLASDYTVYKDIVMVEVTNTVNSDRLYVEINLETGSVIERGVISEGNRKVTTFLPLSS